MVANFVFYVHFEMIQSTYSSINLYNLGRDGPQLQNLIKKTGGKAIIFKERKDKYSNEPS